MKPASIDIAAELVWLEALTNFELRGEWRRLHHMQPPKSLSRDLLQRGITYKIQEGVRRLLQVGSAKAERCRA